MTLKKNNKRIIYHSNLLLRTIDRPVQWWKKRPVGGTPVIDTWIITTYNRHNTQLISSIKPVGRHGAE